MTRPRIAFLGAGWIGRNRLQAVVDHGGADIVAIADPDANARDEAIAIAPDAQPCDRLAQLLELPIDGVVIATPSAGHADQALAVLGTQRAVFCQKPLARTAQETELVVARARQNNCLLGVDLSYRHTAAMRRIRELVQGGELGRVYAIDLVFHNAYGPQSPWFYDKAASGGGCVIDLGIHLVDLALWLLEFPEIVDVESQLYTQGLAIQPSGSQVEDFAAVHLRTAAGVLIRLICSWRISAGRDAVIEAAVFGTGGGAAMKNVDGSFYDFTAELYRGTRRESLCAPPDAWGGRAITAWVDALASGSGYDPAADTLVDVARVLDAVYARGPE